MSGGMLLFDLRVLVVDPDPDSAGSVASHLKEEGATVQLVRDAAEAVAVLKKSHLDVIVCELDLPDLDGHALLQALRQLPRGGGVPAIAVTRRKNLIEHTLVVGERFEKYLAKPVRSQDMIDAVCCVVGDRKIPPVGTPLSVEALGDGLVVHDYRFMLGALNAPTPYRYTALLRFEEHELTSIWTFDREKSTHDPFMGGVPVAETPFEALRRHRGPLVVDDANEGAWVFRVPAPFPVRSFAGVPLRPRAESPFGVLCHFDEKPRPMQKTAVENLERAARMISFARRSDPSRRQA